MDPRRQLLHDLLGHTLDGTDLPGLGAKYEGKVRDNYVANGRRTIVVTDRLSAFDRVLTTIPCKGQVINQLAQYWFEATAHLAPNHVLSVPDPVVTIARECRPVQAEFVMRAYLTGVTSTSIWVAYQRGERSFCGHALPAGMVKNQRLPAPILTPSTKAASGSHDENIDLAAMVDRLAGVELDGRPLGFAAADDLTERIRDRAIALYRFGLAVAARAGIIVADTKFEFGLLPDGQLLLIDEALTPDSSRFWDAATYQPGRAQASYDKQYVRDWLETQPWAKTAPGPALPDAIVEGTRARYVEAFERITGASFSRYLQEDVIAR